MANAQTFPQSLYPLNGDVVSTTGNPEVTVTGIQTTAVSAQPPKNGQLLIYDQVQKEYIPGDPIVSGPDAPGSAPSVNPVQVAGVDSGGLVRELQTDTSGSLYLAGVEQRLDSVIQELRAMKIAIIALDNTLNPSDFEAASYTDLSTAEIAIP